MELFRILVPATDENFDEAAYLAANRDVADAVAAGVVASGRVHFDAFGRADLWLYAILAGLLFRAPGTWLGFWTINHTGVQTYLATWARSFKEAQTYMGFLIMVPVLPGMLSALYPVSSKPWMYPVPLLGQHMLAADVLGGKPAPAWAFLVSGLAALAVAMLTMRLTTRMLQRERIIFSR